MNGSERIAGQREEDGEAGTVGPAVRDTVITMQGEKEIMKRKGGGKKKSDVNNTGGTLQGNGGGRMGSW